ncbi:hypothetical protein TREMEDRAFT_67523 [Tremella mesenterica DSM 1558]|uniref:uncharacterized protein n=1 Tax=Tremella mesenterica (strain ATCC 24925 / CBS 8224 / DSM 1558 / NBRC 9311 / NRRL Y-6157 / RJB 2259-6 / UBC 559-6) TaxID=578456 RepID=UPI0003F49CEE|nr:uncharacterized protein TREMEDRAFT_67523 [Tremella mesenterica DSM 1558]EIW70984.1 hypothetical protein TREMEDRAFT_67523 [Tremella mesenterica DSM 1558]
MSLPPFLIYPASQSTPSSLVSSSAEDKTPDIPSKAPTVKSTPPSQDRLFALYSFTSSQRTTNPTGYSVNLSWWSKTLEDVLSGGWMVDRLILRVGDGLISRLEWEGRRVKGLGGVIEHLSHTSPPTLHSLNHFLSSQAPLLQPPSLSRRFIGTPLWWILNQLNPFNSGEMESEGSLWKRYKGDYVHLGLLQQVTSAFISYIRSHPPTTYTESLHSTKSFIVTFSVICIPKTWKKIPDGEAEDKLSDQDMKVLLKWLERDCGVLVTDGEVIKILSESQTGESITEADRGTLQVLTTLRKVDEQVEKLEEEIQLCQEKAKKHLSSGQRTLAISRLRSKKALEDVLEKRLGAGEQLRAVVRSVDQAQTDVEVMAAYQTSTSTLRQLLSHPSLSLDKVEETTEALASALADQREVDDAMAIGEKILVQNAVDEDDLEKELEAMVKDAEEVQKKEKEMAEASLARAAERAPVHNVPQREKVDTIATSRLARSIISDEGAGKRVETPLAMDDELSPWEERYLAAREREVGEKMRAEKERLERQMVVE